MEGVVSTDGSSAAATQLHQLVGLPLTLALAPAPLVLAGAIRPAKDLQFYRPLSVVVGMALVVVAVLSLTNSLPVGVAQRSDGVLETIWFFATGLLLLRIRNARF